MDLKNIFLNFRIKGKAQSFAGFQIENEYGAFGYDDQPRDKPYLRFVKSALESNGIESLLFTSDSPKQTSDWGSLEGGEDFWVPFYTFFSLYNSQLILRFAKRMAWQQFYSL